LQSSALTAKYIPVHTAFCHERQAIAGIFVLQQQQYYIPMPKCSGKKLMLTLLLWKQLLLPPPLLSSLSQTQQQPLANKEFQSSCILFCATRVTGARLTLTAEE
jgi:hypothetical protein